MTNDASPSLRIALFGMPGAGKSTSAGLLVGALRDTGRRVTVVKTAAPLYDVQESFYARTGSSLEPAQQDGALLNFLGSHFRAVAPGFLLEDFARRCGTVALGGVDVIVSDDARPVDLPELARQGFQLVRVSAPDDLRRQRRAGRGDRTIGSDTHPTEQGGDDVTADHEVVNSGTVDDLRSQIGTLVEKLLAGHDGVSSVAGDDQATVDELVGRARAVIAPRYVENRHQIGAIVVSGDGRVFSGVHLEAMVGRASICAEAVALGNACAAGATDLRVVVSVRHPKPSEPHTEIRLVPPCGLCRELLLDYGPQMRVVVDTGDGPALVPLAGLLPHKYVGTKWAVPARG